MGSLARLFGRAGPDEVEVEDGRDERILSVVGAVMARMLEIAEVDRAQMSVGVSPDGRSLVISYAVSRILRSDSFRCDDAGPAFRHLLASVVHGSGFDLAEAVYFQEVETRFAGRAMRLLTIPGEPTRFVLVEDREKPLAGE